MPVKRGGLLDRPSRTLVCPGLPQVEQLGLGVVALGIATRVVSRLHGMLAGSRGARFGLIREGLQGEQFGRRFGHGGEYSRGPLGQPQPWRELRPHTSPLAEPGAPRFS